MPNIALLNRGLRLTPGTRSQVFVDAFGALSDRWLPQAGTLAVAGGALRAATLGDWLSTLVLNGAMESGAPPSDWTYYTAIAGTAAERTGGDGTQSLSLVNVGASNARAVQNAPTIVGTTVRLEGWAKKISSRATITLGGNTILDTDDTGVWVSNSGTRVCTSTSTQVMCRNYNAFDALESHYDDIAVYRQNAPALLAGWRSPNHVATLSHISPAAGVVPFGYLCRYTDSLNYWEVRVLPNTAGNDLQIIQVTAGVGTTRAEADIDWTSNDTDELEVTCSGSTISTAHRKSGAGTWTAGPSYASATQGQTSPQLGVMLYETGVGRVSAFKVVGV